jgi:anti-sigma factor (TIGR02949 family)
MVGFELDPCAKCEEVMQPFLDRILDETERAEAERHLELCGYCARRYRFEDSLRRFVRQATIEPMPPDLKAKLSALRIAL